jgi:LPS-assembly lipoprotein
MLRNALIVILLAALLGGCGFQLRDRAELPPEMALTQMVVDDPYSPLAKRVQTLLEQNGVEFVSASRATAILEIPVNESITSVLTIADTARVREFQVSLVVRFRLLDAGGTELLTMQTLRQSREISFDEQKILATSREQEYLKDDLAQDLARQLVSRLESVSAGSP